MLVQLKRYDPTKLRDDAEGSKGPAPETVSPQRPVTTVDDVDDLSDSVVAEDEESSSEDVADSSGLENGVNNNQTHTHLLRPPMAARRDAARSDDEDPATQNSGANTPGAHVDGKDKASQQGGVPWSVALGADAVAIGCGSGLVELWELATGACHRLQLDEASSQDAHGGMCAWHKEN